MFLILTGVKMLFAPEKPIDPDKNPLIRLFRRFVPVTPELHGQQFFVRRRRPCCTRRRCSWRCCSSRSRDIIFAVDSVPAIFALTREPLIVFTSNVFAILGLRAMYFLLAGAVDRSTCLKYGLALVLVFVGLKMVWLNEPFGGKFPITWSLAIIGSILALSMLVSVAVRRRAPPAGH